MGPPLGCCLLPSGTVKKPISYSIFVDDGFPEADEFSNNYVERRPANDTNDRVSHVSVTAGWFERQCLVVRAYLGRFGGRNTAVSARGANARRGLASTSTAR